MNRPWPHAQYLSEDVYRVARAVNPALPEDGRDNVRAAMEWSGYVLETLRGLPCPTLSAANRSAILAAAARLEIRPVEG